MTKIFISHSSKDNEFAKQLAQALIDVGIDVWLDLADIPASMKWSTAVQHGLDECDAMILIITPDAMASVNVEDEWQYYFDKKKKVFPVQWKPAEVHFQLRRIQYVDFHEKEFVAAFAQLCVELQKRAIMIDGSGGQLHEIQSGTVGQSVPPQLTASRAKNSVEEERVKSAADLIEEAVVALRNNDFDKGIELLKEAHQKETRKQFVPIIESMIHQAEVEIDRRLMLFEIGREYSAIAELVNNESTRKIGCDALKMFHIDFPDYDPEHLRSLCIDVTNS